MQAINEPIAFTAIQQCLETADHYIRQGNRRDAEFGPMASENTACSLIHNTSLRNLLKIHEKMLCGLADSPPPPVKMPKNAVKSTTGT